MYAIGFLISLTLLIIGITVFSNLIFFPRLQSGQPDEHPLVSVLIPARDEAAMISQIVEQVLAQTYRSFELIVLDDESSDGTADLAIQAANGDGRFQIVHGEKLPPGWLGTNWACHQLSQIAHGDLLLFLDADVQLRPSALASMVAQMGQTSAQLLAIWPTQITASWGERLVVPLIAFAIMGYLPALFVHHTPWPVFAAANGQCLLFTHSAYLKCGGHAAVRNQVVEDVALARRVKALVYLVQKAANVQESLNAFTRFYNYFRSPLRMAYGNRLVLCHMYPAGWLQVRNGFAKNILAGHGDSPAFLCVSSLFHWLVFLIPWVWWATGGGWWALVLGLNGLLVRAMTAAFTHQRIFDALLMPISVLLMTRIAWQSIVWRYKGTGEWKGREIQGKT